MITTTVRLAPSLHHALVAKAADEGVSFNTLVATLLAGGIGYRADEPENGGK